MVGRGKVRQGLHLHEEATMPAVTRQFPFSLNVETDADVIEYLDAQDNRTEAIRRAIRKQMREDNAS